MLHYFAYGSNMLVPRLQRRCPTARFIGPAALAGYELAFSKRSVDGSGKATVQPSAGSIAQVYGAIFELAPHDLAALDRIEGVNNGYQRLERVTVQALKGQRPMSVTTYQAETTHWDDQLQPYDWYLELVVAGAVQAGLPDAYRRQLADVSALPDPNPDRPTRQEALSVLAEAEPVRNS
jgi:gamma-glutamylcyclotransferase (GGCT)/AIG2-like uncharacterized protein YtfP